MWLPVAFRILVHESECVALVGPGERNTLQQQLDGKRAGLPAFGNGLDNLGRNIGESQKPTEVRVTQAEAASNLYRVGISPLSQREHPRPCSSVSQPGLACTGDRSASSAGRRSVGLGLRRVMSRGPFPLGGLLPPASGLCRLVLWLHLRIPSSAAGALQPQR
jgi:hypothetical protein